jgi:hypothetical protein
MQIRHLVLALITATALIACGKTESHRPPVHKRPNELHVYVDTAGGVELEGRAMSLDSVKMLLAAQKSAGKVVYYTRERPGSAPTPAQWVVFAQVREIGLPIRFEGDTMPYTLSDSE